MLVLDEAFAAIDQETESRIAAAIADWLPGVTQIVVAHRPATLARCRRVVLLQDGRRERGDALGELVGGGARAEEPQHHHHGGAGPARARHGADLHRGFRAGAGPAGFSAAVAGRHPIGGGRSRRR